MRYWTLDEATAALPAVRERVHRITELIAKVRRAAAAASGNGNGRGPSSNGHAGTTPEAELQALVAALEEQGIVLRDPERGLIDFPARSPSGRDYLLCWLDGEDAIEWWHWPDAGFAGRTSISDPPD